MGKLLRLVIAETSNLRLNSKSEYLPSKMISISDGLLDVLIIRDAKVGSWIALGKSMRGHEDQDAVKHWQGREIYIECDPPQDVQGDGEIWGQTPVSVQVLPGVLPILTPSAEMKS